MALAAAHEGYEYQDLLTAYFILNELFNERSADFIIDRKEYEGDIIDDLLIVSNNKKYKKQIKYSNEDYNHVLCKADLSSDGNYNLALDSLYGSWVKNSNPDGTDFRICLSWQEPVDDLTFIIEEVKGINTFAAYPSKVFKIDGKKLWPDNSLPLSTWRRFRKESEGIDRLSFLKFCECLKIEVLMPKISLNLSLPGELENIVLDQAKKLGIGIFPNTHLQPETFILALLAIIKRARSKGLTITTSSIFHELNIRKDYGSIEQHFPVDESENIARLPVTEAFLKEIEASSRILLSGEPGSGKSWFIDNLISHLKSKNTAVIKHLCYTDLNDSLQRERIKLNVFYGNLISDILHYYPALKKIKKQKFASSLSELNHLLAHIENPLFIIIDGLDHIERIANFREFNDIALQDRAIIESLESVTVNANVKIVVSSQHIPQLGLIPNFEKKTVPLWTEHDVKCYLKKNKIANKLLKKGLSTAAFLHNKCSGNPLYLKYLTDGIKQQQDISLQSLDQFPQYSYNLSEYYNYLLSQLQLREDVPQVMSAVSFSLTKTELQEITHGGDLVEESLLILSPVLKTNISLSGYSIYHESFRRFIIDHLKSKSVSINQKVFRPVSDWFDSKDFFTYQKSYRYYLQFLNEGGAYEKILSLLDDRFVHQSIMSGKSWQLIEKNYHIFVKAACSARNFPSVVLLSEIGKIISSCKDQFKEIQPIYLEAVGMIYGFDYLSSYLTYEGSRTVSYLQGLKACYLCDQQNAAAPWETYMEYFRKAKKISPENYKYLIRGLLVLRNEKRLNQIAGTFKVKDQYFSSFVNELKNYSDQQYIESLKAKYSKINRLTAAPADSLQPYYSQDLVNMAESIMAMDNVFDKEVHEIKTFFIAVKNHLEDQELLNAVIDRFKGRNWFYNWLIYYIKIQQAVHKTTCSYEEVKDAFEYLTFKLEPFEGQPRTCDLYSLQPFIYESFSQGLKSIRTAAQWDEIIRILVLVCDNTTTSLQRSMSGPLAADKLFQLLSENAAEQNYTLIIDALEKQLARKSEYHLHTDIAEFNLRLAGIYAIFNDKNKAVFSLKKGIDFSLAYTMRKDRTLMDMIDGVEFYHILNPEKSLEALRTTRILIDSAIAHTDGKETIHFPNLWFEKFMENDLHKASLYLLNELKSCRYSWSDEKSLVDFLCKADGAIDPEIEACLALTFPLEDSEKFVMYCIKLYEKLLAQHSSLSGKLLSRITSAMQPSKNQIKSNALAERYNSIITDLALKVPLEAATDHKPDSLDPIPEHIAAAKPFSKMTDEELFIHFEKNSLTEDNLKALGILIENRRELSEELKELVKLIVIKNNRALYEKLNLDNVFSTSSAVECYYLVCRFAYDTGGWFEKFTNTEAFINAHRINAQSAFTFLFELLPLTLDHSANISFSSNILKLLISLGYDPSETEKCWQNLAKVTAGRFPVQNKIEWETIFEDQMNSREVLVSILLSRFKTESSDRYKIVVMALETVFFKEPENWIKPFQWFLHNKEEFSNSSLVIILQYIYKKSVQVPDFGLNFKEELTKKYPYRYFTIDYIISELYSLETSSIYTGEDMIYPTLSDDLLGFLYYMNYRFQIFHKNGISLQNCFNKYVPTFENKFKGKLDLYYNRLYKRTLRHIHGSQHMMDIFNTDCYDELAAWAIWDEPRYFQLATFIDTDSMGAYSTSLDSRPSDLMKPSEIPQENFELEVSDKDWIRLGHLETEIKENSGFESDCYRSFGGVVFSNTCKNDIPFWSQGIYPFDIWYDRKVNFSLDEHIISVVIQEDPLEFFKLLWLNPKIIKQLKLKTVRNAEGLHAVDQNGKKALYMRSWSGNFLGAGHHSMLSDEIPALEGTDLMIRKDYFKKITALFDHKPGYFVKMTTGYVP